MKRQRLQFRWLCDSAECLLLHIVSRGEREKSGIGSLHTAFAC